MSVKKFTFVSQNLNREFDIYLETEPVYAELVRIPKNTINDINTLISEVNSVAPITGDTKRSNLVTWFFLSRVAYNSLVTAAIGAPLKGIRHYIILEDFYGLVNDPDNPVTDTWILKENPALHLNIRIKAQSQGNNNYYCVLEVIQGTSSQINFRTIEIRTMSNGVVTGYVSYAGSTFPMTYSPNQSGEIYYSTNSYTFDTTSTLDYLYIPWWGRSNYFTSVMTDYQNLVNYMYNNGEPVDPTADPYKPGGVDPGSPNGGGR